MNPATLLARLTVEALARAGVRNVLLCPGSRSAPLAYELAAAEADGGPRLHVRHDERVAAFTALGASGAVVTTSGTAVANLHPAVLEAYHGDRSLVVVTADRPPALRGTWANQTSELQADVFGAAVRARLDLADTDAAKDPDAARAALDEAIGAAFGDATHRSGPVHLNLGFTEPLVPDDDGEPRGDVRVRSRPPTIHPIDHAWPSLPHGPRTVVLAGHGAPSKARDVAEQSGWPLLAEPSSRSRGGPNAVGPYRLLLELPEFGGAVERVVVFGRPTLSRPVTRLVNRADIEVVLVSPYPDWPDPGRPVTRCTGIRLGDGPPVADADDWLAAWREAGRAASGAIDAVLDTDAAAGRLSGPLLAREVAAALRPGEALVSGASNPIRDLDLAARIGDGPWSLPVVANRGLSGIDGTLSTATGYVLRGGRARVLVGDLTFLHDVNALLVPPDEQRVDLQIVVLNDDGGGIFSLLEYGQLAGRSPAEAATFDRLFGTPHHADLGNLCAGYGVPHELVTDLAGLRRALADPTPGTSVVEVRSGRAGLRDLHARLRAAVRTAVTG